MSKDFPIHIDNSSSDESAKILRSESSITKRKRNDNNFLTSETKSSASTNAIQPLSSVACWASIVDLLHTNSDDSDNEFRSKKIKHQTKRNKLGS